MARSPLTWLGGLLVVYLGVPLGAFVVRLVGSQQRGFSTPGLGSALRVSVESATISTALIALVGIPLAHALARARGPVAAAVGVVVQLPLALPPVMAGIVLIYLVGPYTTLGRWFGGHLTGSLTGVVLAQTFVAAPFLIIAARSAFATVDPALDDLAASLGRRPLARFRLVALPGAAPGIRAGLLLTWLRAFGEYGATVVIAYHPYSLPVFTELQFSGAGIPDTQAPTALAIAAAAVAVLVSRIRRPARLAPRADAPDPRPPGPRALTTVTFDLDVRVGTFHLVLAHAATSHRLAILGASGSGKSITLRSLAGLLGPSAGAVAVAGASVDAIPTEDRHIGYLPQGAGLFPTRTVWQQLLFAPDADPHLAAWWLDTLRIAELGDRRPDQLSGGQRQRVGLAQALSRNPRLVLLDEPFSALDAPVRDELRRELRRLQRTAGLSTVLVTHDPEEAALLADEVLVMADGRLLQAGSVRDVYRRPASPEVARLLGIHNLLAGTVAAGGAGILVGDRVVGAAVDGLAPGAPVLWCVRAEQVGVAGGGGAAGGVAAGGVGGVVVDLADLGAVTALTVRLGLVDGAGPELRVRVGGDPGLVVGDVCRVDLPADGITVWPAPTVPPELDGSGAQR